MSLRVRRAVNKSLVVVLPPVAFEKTAAARTRALLVLAGIGVRAEGPLRG